MCWSNKEPLMARSADKLVRPGERFGGRRPMAADEFWFSVFWVLEFSLFLGFNKEEEKP